VHEQYTSTTNENDNALITYGTALNTANATTVGNWSIKSNDDANFGSGGKTPSNVYRKSNIRVFRKNRGIWELYDYNYDWAYELTIFLKLPFSMVQGKTNTIELNAI
jgi:hypothetical protein